MLSTWKSLSFVKRRIEFSDLTAGENIESNSLYNLEMQPGTSRTSVLRLSKVIGMTSFFYLQKLSLVFEKRLSSKLVSFLLSGSASDIFANLVFAWFNIEIWNHRLVYSLSKALLKNKQMDMISFLGENAAKYLDQSEFFSLIFPISLLTNPPRIFVEKEVLKPSSRRFFKLLFNE
eukprot:snap_masked-scaffold_13-processed-gene-6.38-mRNA-1 protein AED:1.00 eAED:1.00 QI:0/-1/0/0/-1/1/1/0/175